MNELAKTSIADWPLNHSVLHDTCDNGARLIWKSFLEVGGLGRRFLYDFVKVSLSLCQESWLLLSGNWNGNINFLNEILLMKTNIDL